VGISRKEEGQKEAYKKYLFTNKLRTKFFGLPDHDTLQRRSQQTIKQNPKKLVFIVAGGDNGIFDLEFIFFFDRECFCKQPKNEIYIEI
jgi:hypothetical protein